ncbi:MAG: hypothetical protein Q8R00_00275 [Candidatus Nanoarchaeia archaeon]|nr:hypothetical protein [Candidatus Nanoarchaeia archaeon]
MAKTLESNRSNETRSTQRYGVDIYLRENPLESNDLGYLEKILQICEGFNYFNVVHHAIGFGNPRAMPSVTDEDQIGKRLEGGITIRARYSVSDIREHYEKLSKL